MRRSLVLALALWAALSSVQAADNIVVNDALGGFKTLSCTDAGGVCTMNVGGTISGGSVTVTSGSISLAPASAAGNAIVPVVSTAVETGHVIKASAGNLYGFSVTTGAVAGRVLVHNSTTVPGSGAVTPVDCFIVAANSTVAMDYEIPLRLGTGISLSFSTATTCFTQTDSATAYFSGRAS